MMIVVRVLFIVLLLASQAMKAHGAEHYYNDPFSTDSRIKTYIFNPNDVYLLVLHYGFQSHVEFAKNETIETITLGDSYAWKITPLGNRLFIKPMERNIRTNMTIITNKRVYQFDLVAKELEENSDGDQDMVYVVRFEYPKRSRD